MSEKLQIHPEEEQQKAEALVEEIEAIAADPEAGVISQEEREQMLNKLQKLGSLALRQEQAPEN